MAMKLTASVTLKSDNTSVKAVLLGSAVVGKDNHKTTVVRDGHVALSDIEKSRRSLVVG